MLRLGIVADDLTGASTVGVMLAKAGSRSLAFLNNYALSRYNNEDDYDTAVVSTNTRTSTKSEAYRLVSEAMKILKSMGATQFSKRIDTTFRGQIGAEVEGMLDGLPENAVAVLVPGMPQSNRILAGGYSIINGIPLSETPVAYDARTPVKNSYIPELIKLQTDCSVGLITLNSVLGGIEILKEDFIRCRNNKNKIIIVDSVTEKNIEVIAQALVELDWNVLAVDPGCFTEKYALARQMIGGKVSYKHQPGIRSNIKGTVLVAAGSASPVTRRQIEELLKDNGAHKVSYDVRKLVQNETSRNEEIEKCIAKAEKLFDWVDLPRVIVFQRAEDNFISDLNEEDARLGYKSGTCGKKINSGIGSIVEGVLKYRKEQVCGLYTTGGDTMVAVCEAIGTDCIELIDNVIPQADIGKLKGRYEGLIIVSKGGLTGDQNTAVKIVDAIFSEASK